MQVMRNCSPSRRGQQRWIRSNEGFRIDTPRSKDEDLALFHDMRTRENKNFLHPSTDDIEASLSTKIGGLTGFRISASQTPPWKGNDLLATDMEKSDYDWLLTPPGTPLFPSLDKDSLQTYMDQGVLTQPYSASKVSRFLGSHTTEPDHKISHRSPGPRTPSSTVHSTSGMYSVSRNRVPSPSRANSSPTLRPATPQKTLARSTTMMNRASTRSSPPVLRRTNTSPTVRSSSVERNTPPLKGRSRGAPASPKLQAWQAPELGFSAEPPPNLRTSLDRPMSGSRSTTPRLRPGSNAEARHSYSEAVGSRQSHVADSRQSYGRNSLSSASKVSSSTTSQDRWSSRGSVISSSDDGFDVLEPTFLDFNVMSPSSTPAASKTFTAERYDNEVSSRCSPVANRQRRSLTSSHPETAGFTSAPARKSLEPSMQRTDHRRISQTMFRPLLSSAPTSSFYNMGQTVVRHRPSNSLAEPSITASSNASSEKGVRIFPGNESSDDGEGEVESQWDKSLPLGPAVSEFEVNGNDATHENYNTRHNYVAQYDQENVADSASCVMEMTVDCRADTTMYMDTVDWPAQEAFLERNQTSNETASQGQGKSISPQKSVIKGVVHESFDKDAVGLPIQLANSNQVFVDIQEDISMQQKGSPWLSCDSANPHQFCYGLDKVELLNESASPNFEEPIKPEQERFHDAACKPVKEPVMRSPQKNMSTLGYLDSKQSPQGKNLDIKQPVTEGITNASMSPAMAHHEEASLHPQKIIDCPLSIEPASLEEDEKFPDGRQLQVADVPKSPMQEIRGGAVMDVVPSERLHATEESFFCTTSATENVPRSGHSETEESSPPKSSRSVGQSNHHPSSCGHEPREHPCRCPSTRSSQEQETSSQQSRQTSQDSCCEYHIDMPEFQEDGNTREQHGSALGTPPGMPSYVDSEIPFDSDEGLGANETDCSQVHSKTHAIDLNDGGEQLKQVLSRDDDVHTTAPEEEHNFYPGNELSLSSQDLNEHFDVDKSSSNNMDVDVKHGIDVDQDKSSKCCTAIGASAEASDGVYELDQTELHADGLSKSLVLSEASPQSFNETQPHNCPEVVTTQTDAQEPALPTNNSQAVAESKQQTDSSLKFLSSPGRKPAIPSFSLEEATNTILFCSSIVHDMVYKAASIATEKEEAKIAAAAPLSYQVKPHPSNTDFISSLREKVSKSGIRKGRNKDSKSTVKRPQEEDSMKAPATITQHPTPIDGMEKGPAKVESEKASPDDAKEKSFMGFSVNSNCQCSVM